MNIKGVYFLCMATLCVTAKQSKFPKLHKSFLQRSLQPDMTTNQDEIEMAKFPTTTELFFVKPRNYEADEGRFFKHLLLLKNLIQPQANRPDYILPYLIITNPTNLTNINNNSLNNAPVAAATTPTGTGIGTGTGTAGVRYTYVPSTHALPQALPVPINTPVYQQRQQVSPQIVYAAPLSSGTQNKRRRNRFGIGKAKANKYIFRSPYGQSSSPLRAFTKQLGNVQFL